MVADTQPTACTRCGGHGHIHPNRLSASRKLAEAGVKPRDGHTRADVDTIVTEPCPRCGGSGEEPASADTQPTDDGLHDVICKEAARHVRPVTKWKDGECGCGFASNYVEREVHYWDAIENAVRAWLAERVPTAAEIAVVAEMIHEKECGCENGADPEMEDRALAMLLAARSVTQPEPAEETT